MKTALNVLTAIAVLAALSTSIIAAERPSASKTEKEEPEKADPWNVSVEVLMVAMPESKAIALLPDLRNPEKIEAAVAQILTAIEKKEATLTGWPRAETVSGQRCVAESLYEKRYPTAFGLPSEFGLQPSPSTPKADSEKTNTINDSPAPTAFETRNIGTTLEVEPVVLPDGERIRLSLVPQRVGLAGFETFHTGATKSGQQIKIDQPQFYSLRTANTLTVRNGHPYLIAVHKIPEQNDQIELFIVRATATSIK